MKMPTREEWDVVLRNVQARIHRDTLTLRISTERDRIPAEHEGVGFGKELDKKAERYIVSDERKDQKVNWRVWLDKSKLVMDLKAVSDDYDGRQVAVTLPSAIAEIGEEDIDIEWVNDLPENLPSSVPLSKGKWVSTTLGTIKTSLDDSAQKKLKELLREPQLTFEEGIDKPSTVNLPSEGVGATMEEACHEMQVGTPEPPRRSDTQRRSFPQAARCFLGFFSALLNWAIRLKFAPIAAHFQHRFAAEGKEKIIWSPLEGVAPLTMRVVFGSCFATATI